MAPNKAPVTARPWWVVRPVGQGRRQGDGPGATPGKRRPMETGSGRRGVDLVELDVWQQQLEQLARAPDAWRRLDHIYSPQHLRARLEKMSQGRPGATVAWPKELPLWHIPQDLSMNLSPPTVSSPVGGYAGGGGGVWWGRGVGVCTALIALVLLLLRAADAKFAKALLKLSQTRRRHSEEWPTPNVIATSLAVRIPMEGMVRRPPTSPAPIPPPSQRMANDLHLERLEDIDLPPPYSSCADAESTHPSAPKPHEEPPPPYSACFATYSNSEDGPPSVNIFAGSSTNTNTESAQMTRITVSPLDSDDNSVLYANTSVVERPSVARPGTPVSLAVGETGDPGGNPSVRGIPRERLLLV